MFIAAQETDGATVWINTNTVTYIRDSACEDFLTVHFKYGDLYICRSEKKHLMAALRRVGLEGDQR